MALVGKQNLFKSKWLRVHHGLSDTADMPVFQLVVVSPTTKEPKAINIGAHRAAEIADDLEAAARAIRKAV